MQFMVLTERDTATFTEADFAEVVPAETEAVRTLYSQGVVRQIWLRGDTRGACFLMEAASLREAEEIVGGLPIARKNMSSFTIVPLGPYGGFGPR